MRTNRSRGIAFRSHAKFKILVLAIVLCCVLSDSRMVPSSSSSSIALHPPLGSTDDTGTLQLNSPFVVNSTGDAVDPVLGDGRCGTISLQGGSTGPCTLRAAILEANANTNTDTIQFSIPSSDPHCTSGVCTITPNTNLPALRTNMSIQGPGADLLTVRGTPAILHNRIFNAMSGRITISGLTITGGTAGGVDSLGGNVVLNVINCTIKTNGDGSTQGAGIFNGDSAELHVSGSTIVDNFSDGQGGGIYNDSRFTVTIADSTIANNRLANAPGQGGGIHTSDGRLNITNSTISGNSAAIGGGVNGRATITNSTIVGNLATSIGGGAYLSGDSVITSSTITGNQAQTAGGIHASDPLPLLLPASCKNVLIAMNTAPTNPDVDGKFSSQGFNFIGKIDGGTGFNQPTDQAGAVGAPLDPKLDPAGLRDNGGPTQTIALLCSSPAIDKGISGGLTTDQRGIGFPRTFDDVSIPNATGGDGTDIGALERLQSCATSSSVVQFSTSNYSVQEDCTTVTITVNRIGDSSGTANVDYSTSNVTANDHKDYITAFGTLKFAPGETTKSFAVLINEDSFVEGTETFNVNLTNPSGAALGGPAIAAVTITDDATEPSTNVIDDPGNYVCQQYHDFLSRQPDAPGLTFWTNEITSCGTNQSCIETKRINVSAAFYLSIEFQDTGYLVERFYKTSFGDAAGTSTLGGTHSLPVPIVRLNEFLSDTQEISRGVIVGQGNWQQQLENNKQAFAAAFVLRSRFTNAFPASITAAQFVDQLNANAGNPLSASERNQLVSDLSTSAKTRGQVLRAVADDADLKTAEFNRAFVLMQYFGYLRRNPNDPQDSDHTGFDFWLTKLNQFNGNYINAEMVKAFITSAEYRQRFGSN